MLDKLEIGEPCYLHNILFKLEQVEKSLISRRIRKDLTHFHAKRINF